LMSSRNWRALAFAVLCVVKLCVMVFRGHPDCEYIDSSHDSNAMVG
jgi:hypothetical protein